MSKTRIVIVGYGKIATDQHYPAIAANPSFDLVAVVSERGVGPVGIPVFRSLDELLAAGIAFDAASHCNTPGARFETALATIAAGKHTMLEKPPAATLAQLAALEEAARDKGVVLMTAWHSQANAAVEKAREWLADKAIQSVRIDWREDVRKWHPGQQWIWDVGGFGVFDPGINGLSVATRMLPFSPYVVRAELETPLNRAMPIGARLWFGGAGLGGEMLAHFDWRETEGETWQIAVATDAGELLLRGGGRALLLDGELVLEHGDAEYPTLYARFLDLIESGTAFVHAAPLRIVADAFMLAERFESAAFEN